MIVLHAVSESETLTPMHGRNTWLHGYISALKVGESFSFAFEDWKVKALPYLNIRNSAKKLGITVQYGRHPNGKGYLVKRVG